MEGRKEEKAGGKKRKSWHDLKIAITLLNLFPCPNFRHRWIHGESFKCDIVKCNSFIVIFRLRAYFS